MQGREEYILERILNERRGYLIDDTTNHTSQVNIAGLVILEDTVFTALEVGGSDVLSDMNLSGATLTNLFPPIMAGKDLRFSRIQLASGKAWAITTNDNGIVTP